METLFKAKTLLTRFLQTISFFTVRLNYRVFFTGGVDFDDLPGHRGVEWPMGQSEAC